MRNLFSKSKRQTLIYILLIVWICFGIFGFIKETDFLSLSSYVSTISLPVMAYLWGETQRPSGVKTS